MTNCKITANVQTAVGNTGMPHDFKNVLIIIKDIVKVGATDAIIGSFKSFMLSLK